MFRMIRQTFPLSTQMRPCGPWLQSIGSQRHCIRNLAPTCWYELLSPRGNRGRNPNLYMIHAPVPTRTSFGSWRPGNSYSGISYGPATAIVTVLLCFPLMNRTTGTELLIRALAGTRTLTWLIPTQHPDNPENCTSATMLSMVTVGLVTVVTVPLGSAPVGTAGVTWPRPLA